MIDQASRILRPRGLLDIMEFDFRVYGPDRKPVLVEPGVMEAPWLPRWMRLLNMAVRQLGGDVDAANRLDAWIGAHGAFEDKVYREFFIPTAPWVRGNDCWAAGKRQEGACMREDIKVRRHRVSAPPAFANQDPDIQEFIRSGRPLLLGSGMPETLLDEIEQNTRRELDEGRTPHYIRCEYVYARRKTHLPPPPPDEDAP